MSRDEKANDHSTTRLILSRWWLVVGMALVGMLTAMFLSQQQDPAFESSSKYVIAVHPSVEDPSDVASALGVLRNRQITTTFAEILQSQTLLDRSVRQAEQDSASIDSTAAVLPESNVITLVVSAPRAEAAQEVNALIGESGQAELTATYPIFQAVLLESPKTPASAVAPSPTRDAAFGGVVGAFIGLILATVWPTSRPPLPHPVEIETVRVKERAKSGGKS
jgi:capsular polysaccharide biosynthesis protein